MNERVGVSACVREKGSEKVRGEWERVRVNERESDR